MNYIAMDLEFNQAYPFKKGAARKNPLCPFEIIQIGAVKLDKEFNINGNISILVKPQIYMKIHPIVERLTGINEGMLEGGMLFPDAVKELNNFIGRIKYTFCVWGTSDMSTLFNNLEYHGIDRKVIRSRHINVQELTALYFGKPKKTCIGLKNAAELLGIDCSEAFHNAYNDAAYTAYILQKLKKGAAS